MSENPENYVYKPYVEGAVLSSVWVVDRGLQMFTGISEQDAVSLAPNEPGHIFFFAELTTEYPESSEVLHRDAETGKFVTGDYAEKHPETTVVENER